MSSEICKSCMYFGDKPTLDTVYAICRNEDSKLFDELVYYKNRCERWSEK